MSALTFDKSELGNLEYSLQREMLATDRIGGYMSTTIVCCNTRRYHGLMVAPIDDSDRTYVLLSALDETIIQHDQTFNLALHRFQGTYEPRGHKYITDFEYTPTPTITYRVGGVILKKEMLWIHKRTQLMIRYTLVDAHSETRLRLRPFLAFRDKHALTHANMEADGHSYPAVNGVKCRLYGSFPWLYLQTSKPGAEFVPAPDWYYNFEYRQDIARGYDGYEDLMTTGYFETELKKGESITLLGVARRNGLDENHRGGLRRLHCAPHAQDRLHQLPRTLGAAVRDPPPGQPDGGGLGLSVARGFGPPDLRLAAGHHPVAEPQGGLHRAPSTRRCAACRTACSPGTLRRRPPRTPRCGSSGPFSGSKRRSARRRSGNTTARP